MADKPKKMGRQNYDWDAIKLEYISNPKSSQKYISKKYGIRERTVSERCRKDGWVEAKKNHLEKVTEKAAEKATVKQADSLARLANVADKLTSVLERAVADEQQFNRHIVMESASDGATSMSTMVEKQFDKIDNRALKDTVQSLKMLEDIQRSLRNIEKAEHMRKEAREDERLRLERERWEAEKARQNIVSGEDNNAGVVILPEVLADE